MQFSALPAAERKGMVMVMTPTTGACDAGPSSQGQLHRSATSPAASSHAAVQGQHSHQKPITADGTQEVNRAAVDSSQHSDQHEQTHQHGWDHEQHCVQAMHPAHEQQGSQPHEQTLHQMQAQQESQQHPDLQQRQQDQQHEQQEGLVHEHTQHQHTQYEQAQHEQHPQASQSLGGGNKSPTRRASGYAGRLGFGSSSHSRIEDNAQHANASSRSSSAHTSGMQPHRHSMQPQTDTMQPVPQPDVGQSVQQSNEDQKPHKLERTVHNAESDCDVASGQAPHSAASTTSNATCAAQQDSPLHLVHPDALQQHSSAQPGNLQSHDTDSHSRLLQGDMDVPTCTQAVEQSHANTAPQVSSLQLEQHADVRWESALQTLNHRRLQCDGPRGTFGQGTDHPALGRTTSLQEQAGATSPSATPSFMRPTVSSLVHSTSRQRSLRKSQSEHMI